MEITSDVYLRGTAWNKAITELSSIFKTRTNYSLYILAISIGIMYDKRISKLEENGEEVKSVPRTVLLNHDCGKLDFMFQAAILSTRTEELSEDKRLELAFGEKVELKKMDFLTEFANFGVTKLVENIGDSTLETMEKIKNFLVCAVEGELFDIDEVSDEIILLEDN